MFAFPPKVLFFPKFLNTLQDTHKIYINWIADDDGDELFLWVG